MRRCLLSSSCITILAIAPAFSAAQVPTDHRRGELVSYTFEVPRNWEVGGRAEEQYMRELMSVDPKYKIAALSTFGVPAGAVVTVYEITLPTGEGVKYLDKLVDLNGEKFRSGRRDGLVKEVLENRRTKQGSFDALIVDWESSRGGLPHSRQWVLHHSRQTVDHVAVIVAFCDNGGYIAVKEAIDRTASTLRVKSGK